MSIGPGWGQFFLTPGKLRHRCTARPLSTCAATGRYCFEDRRAATRALREAAYARRIAAVEFHDPGAESRSELRISTCPHCWSWHLTSQPPRIMKDAG